MRTISEASGETDDEGINIGFIKDLIDLGNYRAFGTLDECREAKETMTPKAPAFEGDGYDYHGNMVYDTWICPNCGAKYEVDFEEYDHCPKCGQAVLNKCSYTAIENETEIERVKRRLSEAEYKRDFCINQLILAVKEVDKYKEILKNLENDE